MTTKPVLCVGTNTIVVSERNTLDKSNLKDENSACAHVRELRQRSGKIQRLITAITFSESQKSLYNLIISKISLLYI